MIDAIVTRLAAIDSSPFKAIEGAAALSALSKNLPPRHRLPIAYVYPLGFRAEPDQGASTITVQRVQARIGVAILAAAQSQREGAQAALDIEALYRAVRKALVGWLPEDTEDDEYLAPCQLAGGAMVELEDGLALWAEEFTIAQLIRS